MLGVAKLAGSEDDMGLRTFFGLDPRENMDEMEAILKRMDQRFSDEEKDRIEFQARMEALRLDVENMTRSRGE